MKGHFSDTGNLADTNISENINDTMILMIPKKNLYHFVVYHNIFKNSYNLF